MLTRLKDTIAPAIKAQVKPATGVALTYGAAYAGVIDPEMVKAICAGIYAGWVTSR